MRIEDIIKQSIAISKKLTPSSGYALEKECLEVLELPVFDFGKFDYSDFSDILRDSALCFNEGLLHFPFNDCIMMHSYRSVTKPGVTTLTPSADDTACYRIKTLDDGTLRITEWQSANTVERGNTIVPPLFITRLHKRAEGPGDHLYDIELIEAPWSRPGMIGDAVKKFRTIAGELVDSPLAMAMYLNTTGIICERLPASEALNKARIKRGKLPLPDRYVVRLDFKHQQVQRGDGTHASPRPHYRRGHIRTFASGEKTWVKACIVAGTADTARAPTYLIKG